jgi:hypothetical protein
MTNVLDAYMVDSDMSFLDKAKIQAQVLVPVVRALRAEMGKEKADVLNESEPGALLMCSTDSDIAAASDGEVTLSREQTIMQGAASRTFRYRFAPR